MTGLAAGLALSGKIVFIYSIANFPIMRCLEQIRNDVCYHNLNVNIIAVGGGFEYGAAGYTHHAIEDIAVMRAMPNMTVIAPGDGIETRLATQAIAKQIGPCYLRLGKSGESTVHKTKPNFDIGEAIKLKDGSDVKIISTGGMLKETMDASELLEKDGIGTSVLSMHTLKPIDSKAVLNPPDVKLIVTIEEHSRVGGLYSAVSEILNNNNIPLIGINTGYNIPEIIGDQNSIKSKFGLNASGIVKLVKDNIFM
jgi:transketolase